MTQNEPTLSLNPAIPNHVTTAAHLEDAVKRVMEVSPFATYHLLSMKRVHADWVETCATDGKDLFYNEAFVRSLDSAELAYVLAHEAAHRMYGHHLRGKGMDHRIYGNAADYVINGILDRMVQRSGTTTIRSPEHGLHDPEGKYTGLSTEEVYEILKQEEEQQKGQGKGSGKGLQGQNSQGQGGSNQDPDDQKQDEEGQDNDGQGNGDQGGQGDPNPGDQPWGGVMQSPEHQTETKIQQGLRQIEDDNAKAMNRTKAVGKESSDPLAQAYHKAQPSPIDYREEMDLMFASSIPTDQSFSSLNRGMWMAGVAYPGWVWQHGAGKLCVVVDVSGSIDYKELACFEADLQSLCEQVSPEEILVLYCDTRIRKQETFYQGDVPTLTRMSCGGTYLDGAFKEIPHLMPDVEGVVCFSDMEVSDNDLKADPGVPTLFVSTGRVSKTRFGRVIKLTMDHAKAA